MIFFYGWQILNLFLTTTTAFNYELEFRDDYIFVPCEDQPDIVVDNIIDMSNLNYNTLDDGSVHIVGTSKLLYDLKPDTKIKLLLQTYKKNRDNWVNTIYNIKRDDACQAIFDPTELWHKYVKHIERKCPFYTGQKFDFNVTSSLDIILGDPRFAGEYKATVTFFNDNDPIMCTNMFFSIYRV